jgi:secreted trypsin-like serine protease
LVAEDITAMLGKHDLNNYNEQNAKNSSISKIIIHPEWKNDIYSTFHADIAIVVLSDEIQFNNFIRPVCLPEKSYEEVVGSGTIVGWGQSSHTERHTTKPKELIVPAVNTSYCVISSPEIADVFSSTSFCAGKPNEKKGFCFADSGSGFYMFDSSSNAWNVRGVISASLADEYGRCDINKFQLYTNVARFIDWIQNIIKM